MFFRKEENLHKEKGPLKFECKITNQRKFVHVLMHEKEDFIMAEQYSTTLSTHPYSTMFLVRKSKMSLIQSEFYPCEELSFENCKSLQLSQLIWNKYNCHIAFLENRHHITPSEPFCNHSVIIEVLKRINNPSENEFTNCTKVVPCKYCQYLLRSTETETPTFIGTDHYTECLTPYIAPPEGPWDSTNFILVLDENVLNYESKIAFGWVDMVGEIGGTIGMVLGWSVITFLEIVNHLGRNIGANLSLLKKINISILILIFFYWSFDTFHDYNHQTEAMELILETKINPPFITVCDGKNSWMPNIGVKKTEFHEWFNLKYPCSIGHPNYKNAIRACLDDYSVNQLVGDLMKYPDLPEYWIIDSIDMIPNDLPRVILVSSNTSTDLGNSTWEKVFHETFGICYTFDAKYWER